MQLALESRKEWLVPMKGIWGDEILLGRQGLKFNFVSHYLANVYIIAQIFVVILPPDGAPGGLC